MPSFCSGYTSFDFRSSGLADDLEEETAAAYLVGSAVNNLPLLLLISSLEIKLRNDDIALCVFHAGLKA